MPASAELLRGIFPRISLIIPVSINRINVNIITALRRFRKNYDRRKDLCLSITHRQLFVNFTVDANNRRSYNNAMGQISIILKLNSFNYKTLTASTAPYRKEAY